MSNQEHRHAMVGKRNPTPPSNRKPGRSPTRTASGARAYLLLLGAGLILCGLGFVAGLGLLAAARLLPAPPVSGTYCIDEKLAWLKRNPQSFASNLVAVGSSTTWRNLDFSVLSSAARTVLGGVVNAAPCFLRANQTRFMTRYLLEHRPETHTVLTILSPRDFEACSTSATSFIEPDLTESYFAGDVPDLWIYFRNLRVESFIRDVFKLSARRERELVFDRFGSGPLTTDEPQLRNTFAPEPSCYRELHDLATELDDRDVQLLVVTLPVMPEWANQYDPGGTIRRNFLRNVKAALAETRALLIDGQTKYALPTVAFTDPVHLQWPRVADFTRFIWREARLAGAELPPADLGRPFTSAIQAR